MEGPGIDLCRKGSSRRGRKGSSRRASRRSRSATALSQLGNFSPRTFAQLTLTTGGAFQPPSRIEGDLSLGQYMRSIGRKSPFGASSHRSALLDGGLTQCPGWAAGPPFEGVSECARILVT